MSEQSGGGPITREQVERAIETPRHIDYRVLGAGWRHRAPDYVVEAHDSDDWDAEHAALTRWRDELAAAEPAEDSPERLRERREALGWTTAYAGHWVAWFDHTDVERAECGRGVPAFVARYAAALSAEEARRAEEERLACAYRESDGTLVWDDSPLPEPERPAPRFKVGDWVQATRDGVVFPAYRVAEVVDAFDDGKPYYREVIGLGDGQSWQAKRLEPASPPAPEVVDVPQPTIIRKLYGKYEAEWRSDTGVLTLLTPVRFDPEPVPIALLRAMLEAIDAQQGGAS